MSKLPTWPSAESGRAMHVSFDISINEAAAFTGHWTFFG